MTDRRRFVAGLAAIGLAPRGPSLDAGRRSVRPDAAPDADGRDSWLAVLTRLAEPVLAVLFAVSVVAWAAAARAFGVRAALLVAAALLVYPAYALMFHELSSETFFSAAFALWALLVTRAARRPSARAFAFAGLGIALLALIRPGNALLIAFALFPFAIGDRLRQRMTWAAAFLVAAILPLAAWAVLNGVRFGDYTLARGGNAVVPFYRAFISDRIVAPDNGPSSRRRV